MLLCFSCSGRADRIHEICEQKDTVYPLGFCTDSFDLVAGKVGNGEVFTSLMSRLGMANRDALVLADSCQGLFDMKRDLKAGYNVRAYYKKVSPDSSRLSYVVYDMNRTSSVVFSCGDSLDVWVYEKPVEIQRRFAEVTISSSLWQDTQDAGASIKLGQKLSDIYAWTIDFFSLQEGDRFKAVYDQRVCEGEVLSVDTVRYAVFEHSGREFRAVMLDQGDGGNIYWNENGESLRKAFLKAPLNFSRISSGFSYARRHPVTKRVQPHTAVDYAAPAGTPVVAIGDGTVLSAGYSGAAGNMVKIRHNSSYTTAYLHLSRYGKGIKAGARVSQGQVIGYVGSTGRSTGPHLDFRVWKDGTPVNPLKMESPSAEPLKPENRTLLDSLVNYWDSVMVRGPESVPPLMTD